MDADDERRDYATALRRRGYEVAVARSGLECLEKLRMSCPDVLVLSTRLLWGGAAGVLALLREDDELPQTPVVLLTRTQPCDDAAALVSPVVSRLALGAPRSEFVRHVMSAVLCATRWSEREPGLNASDCLRYADDPCAAAEEVRWCLGGTFDADDVRSVLQRLGRIVAQQH
jgi:CheY-like chemotaxis protein